MRIWCLGGITYSGLGVFLILHAASAWANLPIRRNTISGDRCHENPYCEKEDSDTVWLNDCNFEKPTKEAWRENLPEDVRWLRRHLHNYKVSQQHVGLADDEITFSAYMAKRYAPNVAPSSMLCDGLGMCRVGRSLLKQFRSPGC